MAGGLIQLVAYGAQDIYLTGNPQITFFKTVYRRHTNFAIEKVQQSLNGTIDEGPLILTSTISRDGDLLSHMWLDVKMTSQTDPGVGGSYMNWMNNTGLALLKECEISIGGQRIDKQYGEWMDVWNELTDHEMKEHLPINKHMGKDAYSAAYGLQGATRPLQMYIPLKFWFCRNYGMALPMIALQSHEVKLTLNTRGMASLINGDYTGTSASASAPTLKLWANFIFLDTDERRRFAQVSHEYLIEQVQRNRSTAGSTTRLNFDHPVKELIWVIQDSTVLEEETNIDNEQDVTFLNQEGIDHLAKNDYFNYSAGASSTIEYIGNKVSRETFGTVKLDINGSERFTEQNASYFRLCQPIEAGHRIPTKHIYMYTFALEPEEHQPSGTCNFSRLDSAIFTFGGTAPTGTITVYAVNYNVLRIMSGMGGLAYTS